MNDLRLIMIEIHVVFSFSNFPFIKAGQFGFQIAQRIKLFKRLKKLKTGALCMNSETFLSAQYLFFGIV